MKTRKCQAFVESKGLQCEKTVRLGKKYCWWHYPKAGPFVALILGAFLGLILSLLFSEPLTRSLSRVFPFHYLDRNDPIVVEMSPNIKVSKYVDTNIRTFRVECRDDCSGLDLPNCHMNLYCLKDNTYEHLNSKLSKNMNELDLVLNEYLKHGAYILKILLFDKANNKSEFEYRFVVPEKEIVNFLSIYEEYEESKHKKLFQSFFNERGEILDLHLDSLYIYHYSVHNQAEKTYCRNLHFSIFNQGILYSWKEISSVKCNGIVSLNITEAMKKTIPKNRVFTSNRMINIDELGPGGLAGFTALVGFMKSDSDHPKIIAPREIGVFGTYVSEGYGRATIEKISRWISIQKRKREY